MTNPNTIKDDNLQPELPPKGLAVAMEKSQELEMMLHAFGKLSEAVLQDTLVTNGDMHSIRGNLENQSLMLGGRFFTVEELRNAPAFLRTVNILRKIEQETLEDVDEIHDLTFLSDRATELLAQKTYLDLLLYEVTTITDHQVALLSEYKGQRLQLGVKNLTQKQAASLALSKADKLILNQITSLTDDHMTSLSQFEGPVLELTSLTKLSDHQAAALSVWGGKILELSGITRLSDHQAASLGRWDGRALYLNGLETLTETQAKGLARFKGDRLFLARLGNLEEAALKNLLPIVRKMTCTPSLKEQILMTVDRPSAS